MNAHELIADYYDEVYPHVAYREQLGSIIDEIASLFRAEKRIRILDICSGSGRSLGLFEGDERFEVTGVEMNDKMLSKARKNYPNARLIQGDVRDLSELFLGQERFHAVLMAGISFQLFDEGDRRRILGEVERLLVRGGVFIFDIFTKSFSHNAPEENAFIKRLIVKEHLQIVIIYQRFAFSPPDPSKQYVYLIETQPGGEPIMSWGSVDIYEVDLQSIERDLGNLGMYVRPLPTKKEKTQFMLAGKK